MRVERAAWLTFCLVLVLLLGHLKNENDELKAAFLTNELDKDIEAFALGHFARTNAVSKSTVLQHFRVGYAGFSDRDCIRLVPKRYVFGGATTYCFAQDRPVRLLGIDRGAE